MVLIRVFFELLDLILMPWQVAIFLLVISILVYGGFRLMVVILIYLSKGGMSLSEWIARLFLLPEYLLTSLFRSLRLRSVPGSRIYDDIIQKSLGLIYNFFNDIQRLKHKDYHFPFVWVLLIVAIVVGSWYLQSQPSMHDTAIAGYIRDGFDWYDKIKRNALAQ